MSSTSVYSTPERRERRGQLRFPDAFGEPGAARTLAEMFFDVIGETRDLLVAVFGRNGDQDRLVETAADDFHLAALHQRAQQIEIFGMGAFDPFQQRAGEMQTHANGRMAREDLNERQVGLRVGALDHVVKVSDRLVRVNEEDKLKFRHSGPR